MFDYMIRTIDCDTDYKVNEMVRDMVKLGYQLHEAVVLYHYKATGSTRVMFIFKRERSGEK